MHKIVNNLNAIVEAVSIAYDDKYISYITLFYNDEQQNIHKISVQHLDHQNRNQYMKPYYNHDDIIILTQCGVVTFPTKRMSLLTDEKMREIIRQKHIVHESWTFVNVKVKFFDPEMKHSNIRLKRIQDLITI